MDIIYLKPFPFKMFLWLIKRQLKYYLNKIEDGEHKIIYYSDYEKNTAERMRNKYTQKNEKYMKKIAVIIHRNQKLVGIYDTSGETNIVTKDCHTFKLWKNVMHIKYKVDMLKKVFG